MTIWRVLEIEIPADWKDSMAESFGDRLATALAPGVRMTLIERYSSDDGDDDTRLREWVTPG